MNRALASPVFSGGAFVGWCSTPPSFAPLPARHGFLVTASDNDGKRVMLRVNIIDGDITRPNWFGVAFDVIDDGKSHRFNTDVDIPLDAFIEQQMKENQHAIN